MFSKHGQQPSLSLYKQNYIHELHGMSQGCVITVCMCMHAVHVAVDHSLTIYMHSIKAMYLVKHDTDMMIVAIPERSLHSVSLLQSTVCDRLTCHNALLTLISIIACSRYYQWMSTPQIKHYTELHAWYYIAWASSNYTCACIAL